MPLDLWEHVKKHRIVVAVRGIAPEQILPAAKALYDGGIRMLEITFDQASPTCLTDTPAAIRQVPLLTMGGVDETNLTEYLALPCVVGTGIGSAIARKDLIEAGRWQELTALALRYTSQLTGKEGAE